jgi:pimeloyl-ACP methyl ester carboxylesterase
MGRIGKHGLAGLLVSVALLAGACLNPSRTDQASRLTTPSSGARADKPCLREVGPARPVRNRTAAGAVLAGVVMGRGRSGIAFAHGRGGDLCEWLPYARRFARQGYRVLAFDFAGFGDSRPGSGADARLDTDVVAAAGQLRRLGAEKIVLVGSSMGGTAALAAATRIARRWPV